MGGTSCTAICLQWVREVWKSLPDEIILEVAVASTASLLLSHAWEEPGNELLVLSQGPHSFCHRLLKLAKGGSSMLFSSNQFHQNVRT